MIRRPPRSTRTDTLFPYTTLFRSQVGTGIAYAFARTPYAHAAAARSLSKKAPGRLFIGLGSGAYTINRDWFGVEADRPVARMSDLAGAIRAWLHAENGSPVTYDGEFYKIKAKVQAPVLGRLDVPILFAGRSEERGVGKECVSTCR